MPKGTTKRKYTGESCEAAVGLVMVEKVLAATDQPDSVGLRRGAVSGR